MAADEILIIGAGPFGLSISAHLRALGVEHRIVGRPMDAWRTHMPAGMNLKSEPYGSCFSAPKPGYDIAAYCRAHELEYVERLGPLPLRRFLDYADWFTKQLVPNVQDSTVTGLTQADGGFRVEFADADPCTAHQVVVATGVLPFARIPHELAGLPADLVSHTSDHHDLGPFRGRRVAVVGAGQSALETAALLNEAGADTLLVVRAPVISWIQPNPERLSRLGSIKRPATKLCEGWHCAFWNAPAAFHMLPEAMRITKARTVLGPNGSWWLKDRVDGVVEALTDHRVKGAVAAGSGVQLLVEGPKQSMIDVDHLICGTGFRVDLARLSFLAEPLRDRIATVNGYPEVRRDCASTIPGLYFTGSPATVSLGPSMRFIAGTHNVAARIARSLAHGGRQARRGHAVD